MSLIKTASILDEFLFSLSSSQRSEQKITEIAKNVKCNLDLVAPFCANWSMVEPDKQKPLLQLRFLTISDCHNPRAMQIYKLGFH